MAIPPYIERPGAAGDAALIRPTHRLERLMRVAMRFIGFGLVVLGGLLFAVSGRLEGADTAIALLFGLICLGAGFAAWWWMGRSAGVHRIEIGADALTLYRAGFAGFERRRVVRRDRIERLDAAPIGERRTARWRVWLVTPAGRTELAAVRRFETDSRPVQALAERLDTVFTPRE